MVEYVLVLAALLVVTGILLWFVGVVERHGARTEALVTSDAP